MQIRTNRLLFGLTESGCWSTAIDLVEKQLRHDATVEVATYVVLIDVCGSRTALTPGEKVRPPGETYNKAQGTNHK